MMELKDCKVGMRVKIIDEPVADHNVGDVGEITIIDPEDNGCAFVEVNGVGWWYSNSSLQKFKKTKPRNKPRNKPNKLAKLKADAVKAFGALMDELERLEGGK